MKLPRGTPALLLAVVALSVYLVTLCPTAWPGVSAIQSVQAAGLFPNFSPAYPLWRLLSTAAAAIPIGEVAVRLNLLSAVFATTAVGLLFFVTRSVLARIFADAPTPLGAIVDLAAAAAGCCLMFCEPFWTFATRYSPAPFQLCLLLITALLFLRALGTQKLRHELVLVLVCGIAVAEHATTIFLLPVFAVYLVGTHALAQTLDARRIVRWIAAGAIGLLLYPIAVALFLGSEGHRLQDSPGFFRVLWTFWRQQYAMLAYSLPRVGWLIVLAVSVVPALSALLMARTVTTRHRDWSYVLMHLVMAGLTAGMAINAPFAPSHFLPRGQILLTPYALTAITLGYLLCYAVVVSGTRLISLLFLGLSLVPAVLNAPTVSSHAARPLGRCAHAVLDSIADAKWLITAGPLDAHIQLAAYDRKQTIQIFNIREADNAMYRQFVAARIGLDTVIRQAPVGADPLLRAWLLESGSNVMDQVAVFDVPLFFHSLGIKSVPHLAGTLPLRDKALLPVNTFTQHVSFWKPFIGLRQELPPVEPTVPNASASPCRYFLRIVSLNANNLGVLLEDANRADDAFAAYAAARQLDPDNLSALLNQTVMLDHGHTSPDAADIRARMRDIDTKIQSGSVQAWALAANYGNVRLPQAFAQAGRFWAVSGNPELAEANIRNAIETAPPESKDVYRAQLAYFCATRARADESEEIYRSIIARDTGNARAWLGLARIALQTGDLPGAAENLKRAEAAPGAPRTDILFERALQAAARRDHDTTRVLLESIIAAIPNYMPAWTLLGDIAIMQSDRAALERCLERLAGMDGGLFYVHAFEGRWAARTERLVDAKRHLEQARQLQPSHAGVLQSLVELSTLLKHRDSAREYACRLLQLQPQSATANFVLGTLEAYEGNLATAEDLFRRSLRTHRSSSTLNELAWLLQQRGQLDEAQSLAAEAVTLAPRNAMALDTLGVILMKKNQLEEAEEAVSQAIAILPRFPPFRLHLAETQLAAGKRAAARAILQGLQKDQLQLPQEDRDTLKRLQRQAAGNG